MKIIQTKNYEEMSQKSYEVIKSVLDKKKDAVINTTTGASYDGTFELLVKAINNGELSIKDAIIMNLDEYIAERDKSFTVYTYMYNKFYDLIKEQPKLKALLDGSLEDLQSEIKRYNQLLHQYPRDLQIVGLGVNGHLGANEPGTSFDQRLFCADSDESTIQSTMGYHHLTRDEAPTQMLTLGLADIIESETILLTASGTRKAQAVKETIEGPLSTDCPASILQQHDNVIFIIDEEAASLLTNDYR
ncbi:glucosamine-6-phosphate deaminase [Gracilibacillus alcaliphilus]|uniref:glucosamine-6-phosphate deaminase n=1 Tax=Gracilibacillus alcaliphilus TaxID=1401441 RepID=UPI00195B5787|nr:glucosamine-6-phosphate deaminase [Gracilibacillus alcaliphilus]MBM7676823.1 glucosamine-6-phosphate deaminase [Gracilibacillus alcaliphilus]